MSILSDVEIAERVKKENMISPFSDKLISRIEDKKIISFGLSSYGYDARVGNSFKVFTNTNGIIIDPKNLAQDSFVEKEGDHCIIPPNGFCLAHTVEDFYIPRDLLVICVGKSTYARCGIVVNVTPLEPEWNGQVTLEFSNTTNLPVKIYANEGACQFLFFKADTVCKTSYKDRNGKYLDQKGVVLPRV